MYENRVVDAPVSLQELILIAEGYDARMVQVYPEQSRVDGFADPEVQ